MWSDRPNSLGSRRVGPPGDHHRLGADLFDVRRERDTPQYGYFATFTVTMTDIAPPSTNDDIEPDSDDFYVQDGNGQLYGNGTQAEVQGGNGFWASLPNDLGNETDDPVTDLYPGQSLTGTVLIDVPSEHGQLVYDGSYDGQVDGSWAY